MITDSDLSQSYILVAVRSCSGTEMFEFHDEKNAESFACDMRRMGMEAIIGKPIKEGVIHA